MRKRGRFLKAFLNDCDHIMRNVQLQMNNHLGCLKKIFKKRFSLTTLEYKRHLNADTTMEIDVNISAPLSLLNQISGNDPVLC